MRRRVCRKVDTTKPSLVKMANQMILKTFVFKVLFNLCKVISQSAVGYFRDIVVTLFKLSFMIGYMSLRLGIFQMFSFILNLKIVVLIKLFSSKFSMLCRYWLEA